MGVNRFVLKSIPQESSGLSSTSVGISFLFSDQFVAIMSRNSHTRHQHITDHGSFLPNVVVIAGGRTHNGRFSALMFIVLLPHIGFIPRSLCDVCIPFLGNLNSGSTNNKLVSRQLAC